MKFSKNQNHPRWCSHSDCFHVINPSLARLCSLPVAGTISVTKSACSVPVVANVMLAVLTPLKYGLKLWWVIKIPPVKMEVRLGILGVFVSPSQNVKRTNQPQTQCVFQCTYKRLRFIRKTLIQKSIEIQTTIR